MQSWKEIRTTACEPAELDATHPWLPISPVSPQAIPGGLIEFNMLPQFPHLVKVDKHT